MATRASGDSKLVLHARICPVNRVGADKSNLFKLRSTPCGRANEVLREAAGRANDVLVGMGRPIWIVFACTPAAGMALSGAARKVGTPPADGYALDIAGVAKRNLSTPN